MDIKAELLKYADSIQQELEKGKDINIKKTREGIKILSLKVKKIG